MNKKFSTLLSGFLLMSAFASAQVVPVIDVNELEIVTFDKDVTSGTYFIVQSNDAILDRTDLILSVKKDEDRGLIYQAPTIGATRGDESDYVWTFEVKKDGTVSPNYYYALKNNEAGTYLTFSKTTGTIVPIPDDCGKAEDGKNNTSLFMEAVDGAGAKWTNGDNLYAYGVDANSKALSFTAAGIGLEANGGNIYLCQYKTSSLPVDVATAALFNDVKGGSGFNLKFSSGNSNAWANDILTDLNLKAFAVITDIQWGNNNMFTIPAGVYFATEYPASLNNANEITTQAQFEACTFLAVNPDKNYDIHQADRGNGIGFDLMTVSGADLNVYTDQSGDRASVKGDVFVGNACFTIEVPDPLRAENAYNLKLANARVQTDASKNAHVGKQVYIGSILDQNKNYLVTNLVGGALSFETTNSTLYDVTKLLKSEDAPSIYTIQFVSELYKNDNINFAGEKNHYLTVGVDINNAFALHSVEDYNAADPMFQFVITGVNKDEKTVTFANRQTKKPFTVSLYENEDGSFTVYEATGENLYVEKFDDLWWGDETHNGVIEFVNTDGQNFYTLNSTKVVLTPVTVEDKFATFVNRSDNDGLVTFELAKNVDDTPEFYVGARKNNGVIIPNRALAGYANARNMTQFELEKVDSDPNTPLVDDPSWITNPYVYKNGSRILTSTVEDTVAYYKYRIKVFEELNGNGNPYYLDDNMLLNANGWLNNVWINVDPEEFIIKENIDGSVSLIPTSNVPANQNPEILDFENLRYAEEGVNLQVNAVRDAWLMGQNYDLASKLSVGLKTFMVEEDPAISYEAIPQHVSFEAVRGGFMTKDENSDARLSISTQAAEDLTFWLDTVHSDRNVPSFYILKNGAYMFNAADSAAYYGQRGNDRFSVDNINAKLIFKTGELVTSDTLRTTVDGRSVLVAEEDNAPKGIKGGLENFQFQIIQAEAGSDEYVIRQGAAYVCQLNNYFSLLPNKDLALRFVIEKQATPTANEGIEVSGVKVIAGNGQITIMGAAGKKVVVSNILGKVVASQTITSDNATIAVPAGIIAVAVEGEAAVKAIVK